MTFTTVFRTVQPNNDQAKCLSVKDWRIYPSVDLHRAKNQ